MFEYYNDLWTQGTDEYPYFFDFRAQEMFLYLYVNDIHTQDNV